MYQVGSSLPTAFRETAEGGLAATPTGRRFKKKLRRLISRLLGESMTSLSAIFFDLDGTLVDSSIGIHNGFTYAFNQLGVPIRTPRLSEVLWDLHLKQALLVVYHRIRSN